MYCGPKQYLKLDKRLRDKSTRHKKWLLNPRKEVTFQLTQNDLYNEAKKFETETEKRRVTMVEIDKLDSNKRSGISPFLYTPEVWPDNAATQNIETTENGSKLTSKMRVLEGDKTPEQFMI